MEKVYNRGKMFEVTDISLYQGEKPIEFERIEDSYGLDESNSRK